MLNFMILQNLTFKIISLKTAFCEILLRLLGGFVVKNKKAVT